MDKPSKVLLPRFYELIWTNHSGPYHYALISEEDLSANPNNIELLDRLVSIAYPLEFRDTLDDTVDFSTFELMYIEALLIDQNIHTQTLNIETMKDQFKDLYVKLKASLTIPWMNWIRIEIDSPVQKLGTSKMYKKKYADFYEGKKPFTSLGKIHIVFERRE